MAGLFDPPPEPFSALPDHIKERWFTLAHEIWKQDEQFNTLTFEDFVVMLQGWIADGLARMICMRVESLGIAFLTIEFADGLKEKSN